MLVRDIVRRLSIKEQSLVKEGAVMTTLVTGAFAYYNYRRFIAKEFLRSDAHYRFSWQIHNCTPH